MSNQDYNDRARLAAAIGPRIRQARQAKNLTQEQTATLIGTSVEFYARLERGRSLPSLPLFIRLAQVLQVSADDLLVGVVDKPEPDGGASSGGTASLPLAQLLSLSLGFYERIERGASLPRLSTLLKMTRAPRVSAASPLASPANDVRVRAQLQYRKPTPDDSDR